MAPVLGYWSIRALAEPIRTLLAYTGTAYEDKTYDVGPPPTYDRSEWLTVKPTIGVDVPNLPYYIDGDIKMSESNAILRHLARKNDLYGSTEQEKVRIDVAEGVFTDQMKGMVKLIFSPDYANAKVAFLADIPNQLKKCAAVLGTGNFIAGDKISYADFMLLEVLDRYELFSPGCVGSVPSLQAFANRMIALPAVKTYRASEAFQKRKTRFFGRMCPIGGGEESY